jgi:hypothetical protein
MSKPGQTNEGYGRLIYRLAPQKGELGRTRKLLEAPPMDSRRERYWRGAVVVALVVALLLLPDVSPAFTHQEKALAGLRGVEVVVEKMDPEAERRGLTGNQIKTEVERWLRQAGVRVLTEKERLKMPGRPYLYVRIYTVISPRDCTYSTHVSVNEMVRLASGLQAWGTIWSDDTVGAVVIERITTIREDLGTQVERFVNDYLAANPKQ